MTPDKTPTDAELKVLLPTKQLARDEEPKVQVWLTQKDAITFARTVLAKWGSPVVAGEPIGYLYCGGSYGDELADWEIVADQHQCDKLNEHYGALGEESKHFLYTTPQPTQAQAGAVPLTQAKVVEAFCALPHQVQFITAFDQGVRFAERHHGIKEGGQHAIALLP